MKLFRQAVPQIEFQPPPTWQQRAAARAQREFANLCGGVVVAAVGLYATYAGCRSVVATAEEFLSRYRGREGVTFAPDFRTAPAMDSRPIDRHRLNALINTHAERYDVNPDIIRALVQQESGGDPRRVNAGDDRGILQLSPETRRKLGISNAEAHDLETGLEAGVYWYRKILEEQGGDDAKAVQNFNCGPSCVGKPRGLKYLREVANTPSSPQMLGAKRVG